MFCSPTVIYYQSSLGWKAHSCLLLKTMHLLGDHKMRYEVTMWHWAKFNHQSLIRAQQHHDPGMENVTMISNATYHVTFTSDWAHPFLRLCNQSHPHHIHPDSWLPSAVTKTIMHTIISLSLCLSAFVSSHTYSIGIPAPLIVMFLHYLPHPLCAPFKPLQKPHMLLYFVSLVSTSFTCCVS